MIEDIKEESLIGVDGPEEIKKEECISDSFRCQIKKED